VDLAGILGFVTFLFTGQVFFPCLMLAISFAGKMFYFPWEAQIDRRKAELSFPIEA